MNFSWLTFCKEYGIRYTTEGPNTKQGNISVHCPFCGGADPSEHMGLRLNAREPYWGCWRNNAHRGRDPARLIAALIDCSFPDARSIIKAFDQSEIDAYEEMATQLHTPLQSTQPKISKKELELEVPADFRPLRFGDRFARPFFNYLSKPSPEGRGFDEPDSLAWYYDLLYALSGPYRQRIILPFFFHGKLVGWTGRHIGKATLRYKTLSDKPETAEKEGSMPAPINPKAFVFNYDNAAAGGDTLFVCEGPMDAIKVDWFGGSEVCAVACLGRPEPAQSFLIGKLAENFRQVCVAFDNDSLLDADAYQEDLQVLCPCPVIRSVMPKGVKDPGDMSLDGIQKLIHNLIPTRPGFRVH